MPYFFHFITKEFDQDQLGNEQLFAAPFEGTEARHNFPLHYRGYSSGIVEAYALVFWSRVAQRLP